MIRRPPRSTRTDTLFPTRRSSDLTIEKRIEGAEAVGKHKTSMLQDVEAGRSLETEALVGAILEMGSLVAVPAPAIEAVYACVKLLNKTMLMEQAGVTLKKAG